MFCNGLEIHGWIHSTLAIEHIILSIQKQLSCKKRCGLKKLGEKSCETKGGSQETTTNCQGLQDLAIATYKPYVCGDFLAATFDFTTYSPSLLGLHLFYSLAVFSVDLTSFCKE